MLASELWVEVVEKVSVEATELTDPGVFVGESAKGDWSVVEGADKESLNGEVGLGERTFRNCAVAVAFCSTRYCFTESGVVGSRKSASVQERLPKSCDGTASEVDARADECDAPGPALDPKSAVVSTSPG